MAPHLPGQCGYRKLQRRLTPSSRALWAAETHRSAGIGPAGPPEGPGRGVSGKSRSREAWGTFSTSPGWVGLPRRGGDSTGPRRGRASGRGGASADPRRGGVPGVGPIHRSRWGVSSHRGVGTHRSKAGLGGAGPAAAASAAVATV